MKERTILICIVLFSFFFIPPLMAHEIRIEGVNAVWLYQNAANQYMKLHPDVTFNISDTKPSVALGRVYREEIDIASIFDSTSNGTVDNSQLKKTVIVKDAPVVIVNTNVPVKSLDSNQIRGIFSGKINNWGMVGVWPFYPIYTVGNFHSDFKNGTSSGLRRLFYTQILNSSVSFYKEGLQKETSEEVSRNVATIPYSIGYTNAYFVDTYDLSGKKSGFRAISIHDGDQEYIPTYENIVDGSYPYYQSDIVCSRVNASPETEKFIEYLMSPAGQATVAKNAHTPMKKVMLTEAVEISNPVSITSPGLYRLSRNITPDNQFNNSWGELIQIRSNDIIFDGMGYTLDCSNRSSCLGTHVMWSPFGHSSNVTIKNVTILGSSTGIMLQSADNVVIENIFISHSHVKMYYANDITIKNVQSVPGRDSSQKAIEIDKCKCTNVTLEGVNIDAMPDYLTGTECGRHIKKHDLNWDILAFLVIFIPKIFEKIIKPSLDILINRLGLAKNSVIRTLIKLADWVQRTQDNLENRVPVLTTTMAVSVIGVIVLGIMYYFKHWHLEFDLYILTMMLVIAAVVVVVHELIYFIVAKRLGISAQFRLWSLGIISLIVSTFFFSFTYGKPNRAQIDTNDIDRKKLVFVRMSAPLAGLLLSLGFVFVWLQGGWNYYIGYLGIEMSIMTSLVAFLPIAPMDGKNVWDWNKLVWAVIFFPILIFYFNYFIYPIALLIG